MPRGADPVRLGLCMTQRALAISIRIPLVTFGMDAPCGCAIHPSHPHMSHTGTLSYSQARAATIQFSARAARQGHDCCISPRVHQQALTASLIDERPAPVGRNPRPAVVQVPAAPKKRNDR